MATQRDHDVEYNKTLPNAPGPSVSQSVGRGAQISESHGRLPEQRVGVTVLRAVNLPSIKKNLFQERRLFVTVSNAETTAKTTDAPVEGQTANWNQNLVPFLVQPSSHLTFRLYAKRFAHPNTLIGTHEMPIPLASQSDIPCILGNDVGEAAGSTPPVTLYVTVTKNPRLTLRVDQAGEAIKRIVQSNTWEGAVERIEWVMDTLGPVAEHFPLAKMAHSLLLAIPKILLDQYQRDDNVQTLFRAIQDAFDFAHHKETLKSIKPHSKQGLILKVMLQEVGTCCDFIQSYAKDPQFWKRALKNIGRGPDKKIKALSDGLVKRRKAFLDQAIITTEITAFQILDDIAKISTQLSNIELNAVIRDIPYGSNSRYSPNKGCLMGTRVTFLDFIAKWVNDDKPDSERGLVLLGQAGTGKSAIAHEIARLFDNMHRLTSSVFFSRTEQSEEKAPYHIFTRLARDLADRYPSFKIALGEVVKDNTALRVRTHDYDTLFKSLILEPLRDLKIVGPILVVIDALDEHQENLKSLILT